MPIIRSKRSARHSTGWLGEAQRAPRLRRRGSAGRPCASAILPARRACRLEQHVAGGERAGAAAADDRDGETFGIRISSSRHAGDRQKKPRRSSMSSAAVEPVDGVFDLKSSISVPIYCNRELGLACVSQGSGPRADSNIGIASMGRSHDGPGSSPMDDDGARASRWSAAEFNPFPPGPAKSWSRSPGAASATPISATTTTACAPSMRCRSRSATRSAAAWSIPARMRSGGPTGP